MEEKAANRTHPAAARRVDPRERALVIGLLWLMAALLIFGVLRVFLTADEPGHFASGYAYLARGSEAFWLLPAHRAPPLLDALQGALIYTGNPHIPVEQLDGWGRSFVDFYYAFLRYGLPLDAMLLASRFATIALTLGLAAVVYRWARDLMGPAAGLFALALMAFDPNMLAHGRLATGDVGVTALGTAALYVTWRWTRRASWPRALGAGALLGLTMLSKLSAQLWVATAGLFALAAIIREVKGKDKARQRLIQVLALFGFSLLVLWAGYGFTWGRPQGIAIPLPAPGFWNGLLDTLTTSENRWVFALGFRKTGSWPWYFPVAFLLKNTLPFIILFVAGLAAMAWRARRQLVVLGTFPLVYGAIALATGLNIGYRHLLPMAPFLYMITGGGWSILTRNRPWRSPLPILALLLLAWHAVSALRYWPNEITFFNELIGVPDRAYLYLTDSNLDWGQTSLNTLADYRSEHPEARGEPPDAPWHPAAGRYLVGASALQGVGADQDRLRYEWFRHVPPERVLDHSMLAYNVPPSDLSWVAECASPSPFLEPADITAGTGRSDLRQITFDCARTWIYPGGSSLTGIYALMREAYREPRLQVPTFLAGDPEPADPFAARRLAPARLSYEKPFADRLPPYVLHELKPAAATPPEVRSAFTAPAGTSPGSLGTDQASEAPARTPIALKDGLTFLGAEFYPGADTLDVDTWWRVETAFDRPFSIMGHLLAADGRAIDQQDGLGLAPDALRPGDVIVQRHRFTRPAGGGPAWLRTGVYWTDTMERWQAGGAGEDAIFMPYPGSE